jgi:hypothetical protein
MSERDDRYARDDLPKTTAEFRARPDPSASTAQFKAFAAGREDRADRSRQAPGSWPEQPWAGEAPARGSAPVAAIAIGAVILVVLVILLVVLFA